MSTSKQTLRFRCPAELEGKLPSPVPANLGVPDWLKMMPAKAFSDINLRDEETVKRCPPFVDAMTCGFLIPLICDLRIENGEIVHPVSEITIAGNLRQMLMDIETIGSDLEFRGSTASPSLLIREMTISGS